MCRVHNDNTSTLKGKIIMLLYLVKSLNTVMYLLSKALSFVLILLVTEIIPGINPLLKSESLCPSSSSSSSRVAGTDFPDSILPVIPIIHRSRQVFKSTSCVHTESCYRYFLLGRPTLARPCEKVHRRTSLMILSLFLQQSPTYLVRLTWMVLEIGGRWPYSYCFVGCWFEDLFNTARNILVQLPLSFSPLHFISVHMVHPYRIDTPAAWKKLSFILSGILDFHMIDYRLITVHAFARRILVDLNIFGAF